MRNPFALIRANHSANSVASTAHLLGLAALTLILLIAPIYWKQLDIWPATVFIAATTAINPWYGLAIGIFITPFQQFAALSPEKFHLLQALTWSMIAARLVSTVKLTDLTVVLRFPAVAFIACYFVLVVLNNSTPYASRFYLLDVGFFGTILLIVLGIALSGKVPLTIWKLISTSIVCAAIFFVVFDFALVYFPLPWLTPLQPSLPPDKLRLAGLHANPNATAKFILIAMWVVSANFVLHAIPMRRLEVFGRASAYLILSLALSATAAKSVLFGFAATLVLAPIIFCSYPISSWSISKTVVWPFMLLGLAFVFIFGGWTAGIAPALKRHAAAGWLGSGIPLSRPDLENIAGSVRGTLAPGSPAERPTEDEQTLKDKIVDELRIGKSLKLQATVAPNSSLQSPLKAELQNQTAEPRDCGLFCTGQRDLLWSAGWQIVRDHWVIGIGYGGWKPALEAKLGYPFDSPHLGFLELWGNFGLLGAALHIAFVFFVVKRVKGIFSSDLAPRLKAFLTATSLLTVSILISELFEPEKIFAMSPHAMWIWTLLAVQDRMWLNDPDRIAGIVKRYESGGHYLPTKGIVMAHKLALTLGGGWRLAQILGAAVSCGLIAMMTLWNLRLSRQLEILSQQYLRIERESAYAVEQGLQMQEQVKTSIDQIQSDVDKKLSSLATDAKAAGTRPAVTPEDAPKISEPEPALKRSPHPRKVKR